MPTPAISYPFPTQIASGQALSAAVVKSDLDHVASQYNTHTHDGTEITGAAAMFLPIGGILQWPGPTSFIANLWYCNGATFQVSSYAALATACGTFHGGNASIGRIPDMRGRLPVGVNPLGASLIATVGNTDGLAVASRSISHKHSVSLTRYGSGANNTQPFGSGDTGASSADASRNTSGDAANTDYPAFTTFNFLIRVI